MRFSSTILVACLGIIVPGNALSERRFDRSISGRQTEGSCSGDQPPSVAPHKNFWGGLTKEETRDVLALLHSDAVGFNLTAAQNATRYVGSAQMVATKAMLTQYAVETTKCTCKTSQVLAIPSNQTDRIFSLSVELMMPNKTEILPLLSNSTGTPTRYALAAVMFGAPEEAYIQEFKVGPLPVTNSSAVLPFTFANTRKDQKLTVVNPDTDDYATFNLNNMKDAEDVTKKLWNLVSLMLSP
jgi:primary-amine oxidase